MTSWPELGPFLTLWSWDPGSLVGLLSWMLALRRDEQLVLCIRRACQAEVWTGACALVSEKHMIPALNLPILGSHFS